jgi:hypothetical protein
MYNDIVTLMAAQIRTCKACSDEFYGRTDAIYCSTACKQQAYRRRNRDTATVLRATGPVPDGDGWMQNRFGGKHGNDYATVAALTELFEADSMTPTAMQRQVVAQAEQAAVLAIREYVQNVAAIARYDSPSDEFDYTTPLKDSLPGNLDYGTAQELGAVLTAVIPRVLELASLLNRRAGRYRKGGRHQKEHRDGDE